MATAEQHETLYAQVRARLLGRHFALGDGVRTNLISLRNGLPERPPAGTEGLPSEQREALRRWDVRSRMRENPLLWSGRLLAAVAAEHQLGHPQAERVAIAALDSIDALYRRRGGDSFDGHVSRWDPVTAEDHLDEAGARVARGFLVDPDSGGYFSCVPHRDPRHVPRRAAATLDRLLTPEQRADYDSLLNEQYDEGYRRWEVSMDELWGLIATYAVLYELVATPAVRSRVVSQTSRLADYLAEHGYLLVRPEGGLNYRGATGALPAFEAPFDRVFQRVTGKAYPARTDFVGAMRQAGYWRLLQLPVDRAAAGIAVAGVLGSPLLAGWLASGTVVSALLGTALTAVPVAAPALTEALPAFLAAAPRSVGLQIHSDTFDVSESDEPAFAHLMMSVPPDLRFRVFADLLAVLPESAVQNVRGFLPYAGLSAVDDPDPLVRQEYLRLMALRRRGPLDLTRVDLLYGCFASAVALLNGMGQAEEERFVELLDTRYAAVTASGPEYLALSDGDRFEEVDPALDYLAGLSLAWLYAKRRTDRGDPVRTPGFPSPPRSAAGWSAAVPAEAVRRLPGVAAAVGGTGAGAVDLFDGSLPLTRPTTTAPELPSTAAHVLVDQASVAVRDIDGDVATGILLRPGEEFEISASGAITAPELFARPSDADGWYVVDDATFALHSGIDPDNAHKYALLGRLGGYFFVGTHRARQRFLYHRPLPLYLRVNNDDARRGAGQGAFDVEIRVWGPKRLAGQALGRDVPGVMSAGQPTPVRLTFRNLGSTWEPADGVRLLLDTGRSDVGWPPVRIPLRAAVPPRGVARFETTVTAPAVPGTYQLAWTLVAGDAPIVAPAAATPVRVVDARCYELRDLIAATPAQISALQDDLRTAAPGEKGTIRAEISRLRAGLAAARDEAQARGCG